MHLRVIVHITGVVLPGWHDFKIGRLLLICIHVSATDGITTMITIVTAWFLQARFAWNSIGSMWLLISRRSLRIRHLEVLSFHNARRWDGYDEIDAIDPSGKRVPAGQRLRRNDRHELFVSAIMTGSNRIVARIVAIRNEAVIVNGNGHYRIQGILGNFSGRSNWHILAFGAGFFEGNGGHRVVIVAVGMAVLVCVGTVVTSQQRCSNRRLNLDRQIRVHGDLLLLLV
mmetsp:Transcript_16968/g.47601  ORF Transcript_16968/g.47601 Transcript_16968/m.47601 type:complete len:228 (-) Transcript_16968:117-800(-)